MLTSYKPCWNPSLGTWDESGASAWNASGENEFGTCLDPDLAGVGFLSSIVGLWRSGERASMAWKRSSVRSALPVAAFSLFSVRYGINEGH